MGMFNKIDFIINEIKNIPDINKKPKGGIRNFNSRVGYAISLCFREKEIFIFALFQWVSIGFAYLLWVQIFDWISEETWQRVANSESSLLENLVFVVWSFMCVGVAAFPVGILTGCMGVTHFLCRQGKDSNIASSLRVVLPQIWHLWTFHWIDGWITVDRIVDRLSFKNRLKHTVWLETRYYAWKVGVAGILPSIITGCGLIGAARYSIIFVKDKFLEVAKLRAGYSAMCWIIGLSAYLGTILFFRIFDIIPPNYELYSYIYRFYFWVGVPILVAVGVVMLFLRPVYVLAVCDLYSDYLQETGDDVIFLSDFQNQ